MILAGRSSPLLTFLLERHRWPLVHISLDLYPVMAEPFPIK